MDEQLFYPNTKYTWGQIEGMMADLILSQKETDRKFQETDRKFQETERLMKESSKETDRKFQETERLMKESSLKTEKTIERLSSMVGGIGNNWGDFLEGLAKPGLLAHFSEIGIEVHNSFSNIKEYKDGKPLYEIDLLLFNQKYVIAVEVKSKLTKEKVEEHTTRIKKIVEQPPSAFNFKNKTLIGAIAAVSTEADVIEFAVESGFFLMVQKSNLIEIVNPAGFKPKEWEML